MKFPTLLTSQLGCFGFPVTAEFYITGFSIDPPMDIVEYGLYARCEADGFRLLSMVTKPEFRGQNYESTQVPPTDISHRCN